MAWQLIEEEIATGAARPIGKYDTRKEGVEQSPSALDAALREKGLSQDERDEATGCFVGNGGRVAMVANGWQYYLSKRMFDADGLRFAEPHSVLRVHGKAKWEVPGGGGDILLVEVDELLPPNIVRGHTLDGNGTEIEGAAHEFTPA